MAPVDFDSHPVGDFDRDLIVLDAGDPAIDSAARQYLIPLL